LIKCKCGAIKFFISDKEWETDQQYLVCDNCGKVFTLHLHDYWLNRGYTHKEINKKRVVLK